jgi:hypothetical protein
MKDKELVWLHTFFDAINAGEACQYLETAGIPFTMENLSTRTQGIHKFSEPPPIVIELFVAPADLKRAQACLHETMHLFPNPEIDPRLAEQEPEDVLSSAILCETPADAENARAYLQRNCGIWSTITRMVDEDDPASISYSVEVKGKDIERAIAAMDRWCESL